MEPWKQKLSKLLYHVIVEGSGISVDERNKLFHRPIQRLQQLPHLSIKMMELLVAIRQKTNHRSQRCTLQNTSNGLWSNFTSYIC